jgi:hypothetical protein
MFVRICEGHTGCGGRAQRLRGRSVRYGTRTACLGPNGELHEPSPAAYKWFGATRTTEQSASVKPMAASESMPNWRRRCTKGNPARPP